MGNITRVGTNGYRGGPSGGRYIEPGEYAVGQGADQLPRKLAEYMVSIGLAWVVESEPDEPAKPAPRKSTKAQHRGNKIVEMDAAEDDTGEDGDEQAETPEAKAGE